MKEYRNVSGHPDDLESGRIVGAGEVFELGEEDLESEYNKTKITEGNFIPVEPPDPNAETPERQDLLTRAKELKIEGRHKMRNDQLQTAINNAENPPTPEEGEGGGEGGST